MVWAVVVLSLVIGALLGVVAVLIVALVRTRSSRPLRAPDPSLEVERRRAEMAEAEIRALRAANLRLHEQLEPPSTASPNEASSN